MRYAAGMSLLRRCIRQGIPFYVVAGAGAGRLAAATSVASALRAGALAGVVTGLVFSTVYQVMEWLLGVATPMGATVVLLRFLFMAVLAALLAGSRRDRRVGRATLSRACRLTRYAADKRGDAGAARARPSQRQQWTVGFRMSFAADSPSVRPLHRALLARTWLMWLPGSIGVSHEQPSAGPAPWPRSHREVPLQADPQTVWDALRDVGAIHQRLAPGLVTDVRLEEGARVVTFGNGLVRARIDRGYRRRGTATRVVCYRRFNDAPQRLSPGVLRRRGSQSVRLDRGPATSRKRPSRRGDDGAGPCCH